MQCSFITSEAAMSLSKALPTSTTTLLLLGISAFPHEAMAQSRPLRDQIVGTWKYVSVDNIRPDGSRVPLFGPDPKGRIVFDSNGN
jgi:hypothetical protein